MSGIAPPVSGGSHRGAPGRRDCPSGDIRPVDTTIDEDPSSRLINADRRWANRTLPPAAAIPAEAIANPLMTYVDQWLSRSQIAIPADLEHVGKNRISQSIPDQEKDAPTDEWLAPTPHVGIGVSFQNWIGEIWGGRFFF